jgi:ATP-dependent DNA helicase RecG
VRRLVAEDDEGQYLEFKPAEERPGSLATSLAAFANADGGTLILGVAERTEDGRKVHVVEGVPDVKIATDHLYSAAELCTPKLPLPVPERIAVDGATVLVVTVPEGLGQVYGVEGRYVVREGSYRRALSPEEIRSLLSRRGLFAYDREPVPNATRAHLDDARVRAYAARFPSAEEMGVDTLLAARDLLVRDLLVRPEGQPDAPLVPSVAGILLLGRDPQQFFPQARVAVVQYAGPQMGESFLKQEIEGPVPRQLDEAEAWLVRNTLHAVDLRGMDRIDRAEYPRSALREAVLNALAHRDYGQRGDRVRIYAFSDRVEVHSPGGLGGPMRLDNLLAERWSRNATLVQGLVALNIIEELGFGLDRMVAVMAEAGLPAPEFTNLGSTFVVTLYGHGHRLLTGGDAPVQEAEPRAVAAGQRTALERQAWALDYLRTAGPLTARDYAAALGISPATALRDLRDLVRRDLVEATGTTNDRRYRLRVGDGG